MKKWRVWAEETVRLYLDIEAETEDEAWEIAQDTDGSEYTEDPIFTNWELERPYRIYEDTKVFNVGDRVMVVPNGMIKKKLWNATGTVTKGEDDGVLIDFDNPNFKCFRGEFYNGFVVHEDVE